MGKKQKKLTDEELEEYRNETYQMMAAISGKPVSELTGESTSRPNYKENYCLIKQMYLKNCINPISSKELYQVLQKQGYDAKYSTFRGLVNNYMKYGYICKTNAKKPFLYVLTAEGKLHAKNPFIAVDENTRRYREFQLNKLKEIIEGEPELFKSIYENIFGAQNSIINNVVTGSAGSPTPERIEELKHDLENKIYSSEFWKNTDSEKLQSLVDGILDPCLSDEEREQLLLDALDEALKLNKSSMIIKQQEYQSSKPIGDRKYYKYLVAGIDKPVTKSLYEAVPFKFIFVGRELRLKSISEAGMYRNNKDAKELDFDFVNQKFFNNQMTIKTKSNTEKRELEFYYAYGKFGLLITTMAYEDYEKVKNIKQPTLIVKTGGNK